MRYTEFFNGCRLQAAFCMQSIIPPYTRAGNHFVSGNFAVEICYLV